MLKPSLNYFLQIEFSSQLYMNFWSKFSSLCLTWVKLCFKIKRFYSLYVQLSKILTTFWYHRTFRFNFSSNVSCFRLLSLVMTCCRLAESQFTPNRRQTLSSAARPGHILEASSDVVRRWGMAIQVQHLEFQDWWTFWLTWPQALSPIPLS